MKIASLCLSICVAGMIVACGQKGPLVHPDAPTHKRVAPSSRAPAATAPATTAPATTAPATTAPAAPAATPPGSGADPATDPPPNP